MGADALEIDRRFPSQNTLSFLLLLLICLYFGIGGLYLPSGMCELPKKNFSLFERQIFLLFQLKVIRVDLVIGEE